MRITQPFITLSAAVVIAFGAAWVIAEDPPRSAQLVDLLQQEIEVGLDKRNVREAYDRYQAFTNGRLDASAGDEKWTRFGELPQDRQPVRSVGYLAHVDVKNLHALRCHHIHRPCGVG